MARDPIGCPTASPTTSMEVKCCPSVSCVHCRGDTGEAGMSEPIPHPVSVACRPVHLAPQGAEDPQLGQECILVCEPRKEAQRGDVEAPPHQTQEATGFPEGHPVPLSPLPLLPPALHMESQRGGAGWVAVLGERGSGKTPAPSRPGAGGGARRA